MIKGCNVKPQERDTYIDVLTNWCKDIGDTDIEKIGMYTWVQRLVSHRGMVN